MGFVAPLGNAFKVLKEHPVVVVPVIAFAIVLMIVGVILVLATVGAAGSNLASLLTTSTPSIRSLFTIFAPLIVVIGIIALVGGAIMDGMYIDLARQGLSGKVSLESAWSTAKGKALRLIALNILILIIDLIIIVILAFATGLPSTVSSAIAHYTSSVASGSSGISVLISLVVSLLAFFILLVITLIITSILFYQARVVVVLENCGVIDALKRSIDIGVKNFLTLLLFLIFVGIVSGMVGFVISLLGSIPIIGIIIRIVGELLLGVWGSMIPTMFYFEYIKPPKKGGKK